MASTNVELVRSIWAPWQIGDFSSAPWAHPDIEYVWTDGPSPGRWTGLAGMADGWREILSAWEGLHPAAEEYRELDKERVAVFFQFRGRGKASGIDLEELHPRGVSVYYIRDGKVTRIVSYFDRDRALADLGLARQAKSPGS
jgi:ketosteroid isomerase-like protein